MPAAAAAALAVGCPAAAAAAMQLLQVKMHVAAADLAFVYYCCCPQKNMIAEPPQHSTLAAANVLQLRSACPSVASKTQFLFLLLPAGPCCCCCCFAIQVGVFVSIISTKIPFKGAGKEYIGDDVEEMVAAVKQAIQQCGAQLRVRA